jgi:hypothetical protein
MANAVSNPIVVSREDARASGDSTFFTGEACRNGHVSPRRVKDGKCSECSAENSSRKYHKNRVQRIADAAKYAKANAEKVAEYQKSYRDANKDSIKAYQANYRSENREALSKRVRDRSGDADRTAYIKEWCVNNPEKLRDYHKKWAAKNPQIIRRLSSDRRAVKLAASVGWEPELLELVEIEAHALAVARGQLTGFDWHVDHMLPLKANSVCGLHVWNNLQVIPATLNTRKRNRVVLTEVGEWLSSIGGCNA